MATAVPPSAPAPSVPVTDRSAASAAVRSTAALHLSEAVVGTLTVAVAVLAWAALGLAHLGIFSLPAVLAVSVAGLVVIALVIRWLAPVRVRVDRTGCLGVLVLGVLAALLFLPGFSYGVTDKDPGGYTEHAFSIARTGSFRIVDPTLDGRIPGGPVLEGPGARFGGLWLQRAGSDVIVPQFYHLWPALLAVAYDAGGQRALGQVAPLLGILAVLVAALALRRAAASAGWVRSAGSGRSPGLAEGAGLLAGGIGGLLLVTNMLEVWQAKYPTTEISAQLLFLGALLGAIVALTTRWAPAAGAAGLLTTLGFLDRGDGLLPLL